MRRRGRRALRRGYVAHDIDSEISTNKEMQRRGIKCAVQETREAMQQADCSDTSGFCSGNCAGCDVEHEQK